MWELNSLKPLVALKNLRKLKTKTVSFCPLCSLGGLRELVFFVRISK